MNRAIGSLVIAGAAGMAAAGDLPVTYELVASEGRPFAAAGTVHSLRIGYSGANRGRPSMAADGTALLSGWLFDPSGIDPGDSFIGISGIDGAAFALLESDAVAGAGDLRFRNFIACRGARALPGGRARYATTLNGADGGNVDAIIDEGGRVLFASDLRTGGLGPGVERAYFGSASIGHDERPPDVAAFSPNGTGAFAARLIGATIGAERGVVRVTPDGVSLLARTGDALGHWAGYSFHGPVSVSVNDDGSVVFLGWFIDPYGLSDEFVPMVARDGMVGPLAVPGDPVRGTDAVYEGYASWQGFDIGQQHPKINAGGDVITPCLIRTAAGELLHAVLVLDDAGLRAVLVEGQTIPVVEGDGQPVAGSEPLQVMLADNGDAFVQDFNSVSRRMIVRPDGSVRVLPGTTRPPGMAPERRWASDPYMGLATMSPGGRVAFFATTLVPNADDRSAGVWVTDDAGRPHLVMNEREPVDFGNGEILTPLLLQPVPGGTGSDGLTTMVNDRGEVLVLVWFSEENGWSLVRATVAGLDCPADLNADRRTDFADLSAFLTAFQAGDPAAEFAAPYAHLDFFDIAEYLRWFHRGCPGD